ncbi:hypothetical protein OESDEN_05263 [Oesophagostomum dentatum]|uniref:SH2 domain-containing protein n=1 Tax=Oesophagostomum dentatum TaxID=61180 RepID=A0A0B1THB7_OESDE|nr:hypothetical protein OESDEN_05263 [Oesophagostomum dentatum]
MPGEYVLTAMWNGRPLHFQINTAFLFYGIPFQLEEESFASVPALVNFYRSHRRPLTIASGCIISTPVDRSREGTITGGLELEASYMHVLKPHMNQVTPRSLSQRVLLNQTALRQNAAARQQRPRSSISHHQISVAPDPVVVPPVPAALANRPLPLPIRSPRNTQDDEEDYSEMDYDAMDGILDASSSSVNERDRSVSVASIPNVMSRQFQSCQNLSYRSQSPCSTSKAPPPLPVRPPLPPRPNFKVENCAPVEQVSCDRSQPEDPRDSAFLDYDEPRTKLLDDDYDKLPPSRSRSSEPERNRLSGETGLTYTGYRVRVNLGYFSSPSPPDEHHASLSQVHLMQLKQFLLTKRPDEISLAISHEHAKMLRFLDSCQDCEKKTNNGLRQILLPSGAILRQELLERQVDPRKDAPLILRKWILIGVSLARHGDAFACGTIAEALTETTLRELHWLWNSLDSSARGDYEALRNLGDSLSTGEKLERHNHTTIIPFVQPILEIMAGQESHYLDSTNYSTEIDSLWAWLDRARDWCVHADESCKAAAAKYARSDGDIMSSSFLSRLFVGVSNPEQREKVLSGVVQRIMNQC